MVNRKLMALLLLLAYSGTTKGQKAPLTSAVFSSWMKPGGGSISPDGKFVSYTISDGYGHFTRTFVAASDGLWKKELPDASAVSFAGEGRLLIYESGPGSIYVLTCGTDSVAFLARAASFTLSGHGENEWIAYTGSDAGHSLTVQNLVSRQQFRFSAVKEYGFNGNASAVVISQEGKDSIGHLQMLSLPDGGLREVWSGRAGEKASNWVFDKSGQQLAFLVEKGRGSQQECALWHYKTGMAHAAMLVNDQSAGIDSGIRIANSALSFSDHGSQLFFGLEKDPAPSRSRGVPVDVWSYMDQELQSVQAEEAKYINSYAAVSNIDTRKVIRLTYENETITDRSGEHVLVSHRLGNDGLFESHWNRAAQFSFYLVSTQSGERRLLRDHLVNPSMIFRFSPAGKWVLYYDFEKKNYMGYEVGAGVTHNLTQQAVTDWTVNQNRRPEASPAWAFFGKPWLKGEEAVLINDNYDIWQVDPSGKCAPINITNGYGRRHHIKFVLVDDEQMLQGFSTAAKPLLFLRAFDEKSKKMGFYSKRLGTGGDPQLCSMGPYIYGITNDHGENISPPGRAQNVNKYLVIRQSAVEAPNYFTTKDFKQFTALTDEQPQKDYNWLTSSLVPWKTLDGSFSTGILYKPENFDSSRQYPILFDYYERRSDELNLYIEPMPATNRINIPWFVSNGYLVFTPDIDYKIGEPGPSAYNAVVSAARYLSTFRWVNPKKMGIQGHSFGGSETNYLVTHTSLFAAACSASGFCDLVSWVGSDARGEYPVYWAERSQGRMGGSLWDHPDSYIRNSPIFNANQVTTPLLMMNNKSDEVVRFAQGVEFFIALRRLGKKVWMLQYDGWRHSVGDDAAMDYTIRMTQFFDHYLKDGPAPMWMTRGIPAAKRGIDSGYEIDSLISTPGPGLNDVPSGKKLTKKVGVLK